MAEWEGKSKGTVTGYKIFIFLIKNAGLNAAYALLAFVSFYYFIFNQKQTRIIYKYFREKHKQNVFQSLINTYRNNFVFGQTIVDKVAIAAGLENKFTYEFDGIENIHQLAKDDSAGILISAHVGNFEVAQHFMGEFDKKIHLVTTDEERAAIKSLLDNVMAKSKVEFIIVSEDLSHIFEINKIIEEKQMICFTGDRFFPNTKTLEAEFLGEKAKFPAGTFLISSRLRTPVLFVYVMRERNRHYHLYARKAEFTNRDANSLLEAYTKSIEKILEKYPLQWFNYYDFWNKS
ncbi:LpxL/LpxP family acyltransferase [Moheibacter sediminis]|uniref:Predicted acyltransferase, LPLAT superfamily n=1 Tax=Moheibacter sediminis TaxID=1434700 RepID=A0A1W1YGD5_9FLAO|nr:lipid A biosynthesis acyltransferase [Moheibacter sediminis]SMC35189.1 Predicted acyltransferase, LPLAT superfamily [Moheibacter sediminis]